MAEGWCTRRSSGDGVVLVMTFDGHHTPVSVTSKVPTDATVTLAVVVMKVLESVEKTRWDQTGCVVRASERVTRYSSQRLVDRLVLMQVNVPMAEETDLFFTVSGRGPTARSDSDSTYAR